MTFIKGICTKSTIIAGGTVTEGSVYAVNAKRKQPFFSPLLTWADWELLQALHKERAALPAEPAPEADRHAPVESYESVCRRLRHAAEERDRALVQVTVYRKAYYNLLQALSTGPSIQAMLDAVRIIDAAVKDHENQ